MSRHKAREAAFQMLFQLIEAANDWQMAEHTLAQAELPKKSADFAVQLAQGAWQKHFETEQYIRRLAKGWQYERLCSVDRLLLHLAMYELKYLPDSPPPIVIDEAIELAREFGTDDSPGFINAVLDKFVHAVLTDKAADYQLDEGQLRQADERLQQAEARQQAAAADIARAAEQAWADKAAEDAMAAARKKADRNFAKRSKLQPAPEPVKTFRKIRKADITEADRIAPEPEDLDI